MTPVTDALGFPGTITVTQTYDYTSPDGRQTRTGTATFVYTRALLGDVLAHPKLFCDLNILYTVGSGKFFAVQTALGKTPGWQVLCGPQPTQTGVITVTNTDDAGHVTTSHEDADCLLTITCTACAPGRRVYPDPEADNTWLSLVLGVNAQGDHVEHAAYSVAQIDAGAAATPTTAEIGPVYRVSIPGDVGTMIDQGMSIVQNGTTLDLRCGDRASGLGFIGSDMLAVALRDIGETGARSPWECEVQMAHFGDTLAAGTISYYRMAAPVDSSLYASPGGTATIADPFALAGQTFTVSDDENGLTVTVAF